MSDNNENEPQEIHFRNMQEYIDYFDGRSEYGRTEGTQMRDKHGKPMFDRWGRPMIVPGTPKPDATSDQGKDGNDGGGDNNSGDTGGGKKKHRFRW